MFFFNFPPVDKISDITNLALIIKATLEGKKKIEEKTTEVKVAKIENNKKDELNDKKIIENVATKFQKEFPLQNNNINKNDINPQDTHLLKEFDSIELKQNNQIINKLNQIYDKYKNNFTKDDASDLLFAIDRLKINLKHS